MDVLTILSLPLFYIIPFFVVLGIIVFVHELGHFLVARWCGVKVEVFSIGFGKELFGFNDRQGTRWKFGWLMLGGYVKFEGDANAASLPDGSQSPNLTPGMLQAKPIWQRMAVVAAGPIANFLLAIVIFACAYMIVGVAVDKPTVGVVQSGSAAEKAGILKGDIIKQVDGKSIATFRDIVKAIGDRKSDTVKVVLERNNVPREFEVALLQIDVPNERGEMVKKSVLGVGASSQRLGPVESFKRGAEDTYFVTAMTLGMLKKIITGEESAKQIGSVGTIADGAKQAAESGMMNFTFYVALLSISVGIMNLLPIPVLDGGHLMFYSIEAVAGKPLGPKAQEWSARLGISIVFMLMAFGMFNDLGRIVTRWSGG